MAASQCGGQLAARSAAPSERPLASWATPRRRRPTPLAGEDPPPAAPPHPRLGHPSSVPL